MFDIKLNAEVRIKCSGEKGIVIGRCEHLDATEHDYRLRYKAADGRAVESWWSRTAIEAI